MIQSFCLLFWLIYPKYHQHMMNVACLGKGRFYWGSNFWDYASSPCFFFPVSLASIRLSFHVWTSHLLYCENDKLLCKTEILSQWQVIIQSLLSNVNQMLQFVVWWQEIAALPLLPCFWLFYSRHETSNISMSLSKRFQVTCSLS